MVNLNIINKNKLNFGTTFGVPWKKGELHREEELIIEDENGLELSSQSKPISFWPDGSLKWTAHSISVTQKDIENICIKKTSKKIANDHILSVTENDDYILVNTGEIICKINKKGTTLIEEILKNNKVIVNSGKMQLLLEDRSITDGIETKREIPFTGMIDNAEIEEIGNSMAAIKITGRHTHGVRMFIPFILRLYFYKQQSYFKGVTTFLYDGNQNKDFIKGLGLVLSIPLNGSLYNRHIRLGGESGFYSDSPKGLDTWRTKGKYADFLKSQVEGKKIFFDEIEDKHFLSLLDESPIWNNFKIFQNSADSYVLTKRTKENCCYIKADNGKRSNGFAYAGGTEGGVGIGIKDFWQKYPTSFEINDMTTEEGHIKAWFYSPDANAMDLRHYDDETHVLSAYEGFDEMRSTPYGIGNTGEIIVVCFDETPDSEILLEYSKLSQNQPRFICDPTYYYETKALGVWSSVNKNNDFSNKLEKELDDTFSFIQEEIEKWKWYGFWDYGDMMRAYDNIRHMWRYDVGGFAWNNNEFDPNIFLWYMFIRTGNQEIFRLAESFTRHASEVDQYHFGEYRGFGSRHNVLHFGCGCKEARISMTAIHKIYYYLTADHRVGDILDEVKDVDTMLLSLDPMRAYFPAGVYPTHARFSPDWMAFTSNWLTQWERYEDKTYYNKIMKGIECLSKMPHRMCSGPVFGYDPKTNELIYMGDENSSFHMANCFGAPVVWLELASILQNETFNEMLAEYGEFYFLDEEEKYKKRPDIKNVTNWGMQESALAFGAYAAKMNNNETLKNKLREKIMLEGEKYQYNLQEVDNINNHKKFNELTWANSGIALRGISLIICMELL